MQDQIVLKKVSFLSKFQRITSNGLYIREIDGLRFIAILLVVLHHIHGYYSVKFSGDIHTFDFLNVLFENGERGVELFFVISGFILSYPFALHYLNHSPKPEIKNFYIRRVTRLEPPYIIATTVFFIIYSLQKHNVYLLFPDYLSSIFYLHNAIYNSYSPFNGVTWSLEIEIQFYLLAPFFCYIFQLPRQTRRIILFLFILLTPALLFQYNIHTLSLFNYIHYFLIGYLLTDIYITKDLVLKNIFVTFLVIPICFLILFMKLDSVSNFIIFPLLIFFFYLAVLTNTFLKKIFSLKFPVIIGGMCYSIYLIHYPIISFTGKCLSKLPDLPLALYYVILISIILFLSSWFYLYLEKPFMDKNWPSKIWNKFQSNKKTSDG